MELEIIRSEKIHAPFVYECLQHLIDRKLYSYEQFFTYYENLLERPDKPDLWIAKSNDNLVGFISADKFYMNRYLGYGVEFEEIVVHPDFRGRGFGSKFIEDLIEYYRSDENCRKVIIKSNDLAGSCRLYERLIDKTDFVVFSKRLNDLRL